MYVIEGDVVMKKIVLLALCCMLASVILAGCHTVNIPGVWQSGIRGRGDPETFVFDFKDFTEVRVELLCDVLYSSAPSDSVTLEIQPNLMKYISVEESGGVLTVRATRNIRWSGNTRTPVLNISAPSLNCVSHAGAGSFRTIDPIVADSFSLSITGAANSKAELDVNSLSVSLTGAGDLELSGSAEDTYIGITGAGIVNALDLETRYSTINLAGVGTVRISCAENLSIVAGGVGTVEYSGSPVIDMSRGGLVTLRRTPG